MPQLLSILHTVFDMGIVLGFMILIHEFGHYAAAKYFGVRVEVFSIGFGKRLLGFRKGETDYRISAFRSAATSKCRAKTRWTIAPEIPANSCPIRAGSASSSPSPDRP